MNKNNCLKQMILRERDFISRGNQFWSFYNGKYYDKNIKINKNKSNKKVKIIVSYYNENLEWLNNFENVLVYNKGTQNIKFDSIRIRPTKLGL